MSAQAILQALFGAVQSAANAPQAVSPRPAAATPPFLPDDSSRPSAADARARINGNSDSGNPPQPKTATATPPSTEKATTQPANGASGPSVGSSAPAGAASAPPAPPRLNGMPQPATAPGPASPLTSDEYWQKYQQENPGAVPQPPRTLPNSFWKRAAIGAEMGLAGGLMNMGTRPGVDPRDYPNSSGSRFVSDWVKKEQDADQAAKKYPLDVAGMKQGVYSQYLKQQGDIAGIGQKQAETGLENAEAEKTKNPPAKELTPQERALEGYLAQGMSPVEAYRAVLKDEETAKAAGKPDPAETAEQDKLKFESTVAKVAKEGLPTDPRSLPSSIAKSKSLTPDEKAAAESWQAANPNPSTSVQVNTAESGNRAVMANAGKFYRYADDSGVHVVPGDKLPQGVEASPVKDVGALVNEAHTANIVQRSLNQIAKDVDDDPEIFNNAAARNILATTLEQIDRQSAGLLIAGTGGSLPVPSGLGDMINTALQNETLDKKTGEAVRRYVADYKSMKDKVITMQMEMQNGKIGRASAQAFKAIADQIPNGATPDSKTAERQVSNLQQTQDELMSQYPDRYGDYVKEKPYRATSERQRGEGSLSDFHVNPKTGARIGWNGKAWVPAPKAQ